MYNRYIPQADGTYRRNRIPDPPGQQRSQPHRNPPPPKNEPPEVPPCTSQREHNVNRHLIPEQHGSAGSFLRQLLPKDLDTGDLLIILLLLLMAGDREEEKGSALLTLALYLLM